MVNAHAAAAAAKLLQSCPTLCHPRDGSPPGSPSLGFSRQARWMGCHFLLQGMKVKNESEVTQSCPTPSNPMDCRLPGSSIHGICQARVLEWQWHWSESNFLEVDKWRKTNCQCYGPELMVVVGKNIFLVFRLRVYTVEIK